MKQLPTWDELLDPKGYWVHLTSCEEKKVDAFLLARPTYSGVVARIIRGRRCADPKNLFQEWAAALQFPYYFGENWDAFDECMADLDWLKANGYFFFITRADLLLKNHAEEFRTFISVLEKVSQDWLLPLTDDATALAIPFRIIFHCEVPAIKVVQERLTDAGVHLSK